MKTTLKEVFKEALNNKKFLNSLVQNPDQALRSKGWVLPQKERIHLKQLFDKNFYNGDFSVLGAFAEVYSGDGKLPTPQWWIPELAVLIVNPPKKINQAPRLKTKKVISGLSKLLNRRNNPSI